MGDSPIFYFWRPMELANIVEQAVVGLGYEFVDLESSPRGRNLRVVIDQPERGITVEDCARVSNHLTRLFAVEDVDYDHLEVSSPGLDRPLKRQADFERYAGHEANIQTRVPLNGRRKFSGVLAGVADGKLQLASAGMMLEIELVQVEKARLVPNINKIDRGGRGQ